MQRTKWQNNGEKADDRAVLIVALKSSGKFLLALQTQHVLFHYLVLKTFVM
jgi:hypothetical protein